MPEPKKRPKLKLSDILPPERPPEPGEMQFRTPLRDVFPGPVPVQLGDEWVDVQQITVGDAADLDRFAASAADRIDTIRAEGEPDDEYRLRMESQWLALCEAPELDTEAGRLVLSSTIGRATLLRLSCARAGKAISLDKAETLAEAATPAQWMEFQRIAWGRPAWPTLAGVLCPDWLAAPGGRDQLSDWGAMLAKVLDRYPTLTAEAIAAMPICRWRLLCTGGAPLEYVPPKRRKGETDLEHRERVRLIRGPLRVASDRSTH